MTSLCFSFRCIGWNVWWQVLEDDYQAASVLFCSLHNHTVLSTTCSYSLFLKKEEQALISRSLSLSAACYIGGAVAAVIMWGWRSIDLYWVSRWEQAPPYVALTKQETDTSDPHSTADGPIPLQSLCSQCKVKGTSWLLGDFWQTNQSGK